MFPVEWTLYVLFVALYLLFYIASRDLYRSFSNLSCCCNIQSMQIFWIFKSYGNIIGNVSLQVNLYQDNQNNWPLGKKKHFYTLYHKSVTSMSLVVTPKRILPRRKRLAVCGVNSALFSCGQWHASHDKFQSLHANLSLAVRRWFS